MRRTVTVILALLGLSVSAFRASAAQQAAQPLLHPDLASLPPNTWVQVKPKLIGPASGGEPLPMGWNCLNYDPVGKRIILLDRWYDKTRGVTIYANAVIAFDPAANTVTCLKVSNWKVEPTPSGGYRTVAMPENAQEPTPLDRHPYDCVAIVPEQNALYLGSGANQTGPGGHPDDTWKFDFKTSKWTEIKTPPPSKELLEDSMEYDPTTKALYRVCRGQSTWMLDFQTNQWRDTKCKVNPLCGAGATLTSDPKRERLLLYGGPGRTGKYGGACTELWSYSAKQNTWTRLADGPIAAHYGGFAIASKHDAALLHARPADEGKDWPTKPGQTAVYFAAKNQWVKLPEPAANDPMAMVQTLAYDEAHDLFVRLDVELTNRTWTWWVFRLAPERLGAITSKAK